MNILKYIFYCFLIIIAAPILGAPSPLIQQLKTTEIKLSALSLDYEKTLKEISKQEPILEALTQEEILSRQKNQAQSNLIAEQIKQAYMLNQSTPLKALLNQDDFTKTNRMLNYHRYIINARLTAINKTSVSPQRSVLNQQSITALTTKLNQLKIQQLQQHQDLETLRHTREEILANPEFIPHSNPYNLGKLLTSFSLAPNENMPFKKAMRPFCIKKISPTEGKAEKFDKKADGILIDAMENQDVHAIAKGRVIYANWLEGYGLLLIIDHGRGFVSLYGRNHSLYKATNTRVNADDIIASVGNTGGYEKPALYFAIRYNKHPIDPARWCKNN